MITIFKDFLSTRLGKIVCGVAAVIIGILLSIEVYLVVDYFNHKGEEATEVVADVSKENDTTSLMEETFAEEETTTALVIQETTTEETTTQEETTTEEVTTIPVVIPMEDLNVSQGDKVGEDAKPNKKDEVVVETEKPTETTTKAPVEEETETIVRPTDNHIADAPVKSGQYACMIHGIDVSKWQGDIDWNKVKAAGYDFVFIRCGYRGYETGALATDDKFEENIEGAQASGLMVGVYFFSQAINEVEAQQEASLVINMIKDYNITYPVVFDWETAPGYRTYEGISVDKMTKIANTFLSMVENAGYEAMIYGNKYDLQRFDDVSISKNYKVWHARYPAKYEYSDKYYQAGEEVPELDYAYQIWQYKSTGNVPGISVDVDMNVAFFANDGFGIENKTININAPKESISTNMNVPVDLYEGVTATNSAGVDTTNTVTYFIYDENGMVVEEKDAFLVAGKYTVAYYIKDFTGIPFRKDIELIVRGNPTIILKYSTLVWFDKTDAIDVLDEALIEAVKLNLDKLARENILSAADYDGDDITEKATVGEFSVDEAIQNDGYEIIYTVADDTGLTCEAVMTVKKAALISDKIQLDFNDLDRSNLIESLKVKLMTNVSVENAQGIEVVFDDKLLNDIENNQVVTGSEYSIKYVMDGMDVAMYYKNCTLVITGIFEETTVENETETETETTNIE